MTTQVQASARRWFPHPTLSGFMWLLWLLLANSLAPGQLVFGAIMAWFIPWLTQAFWPEALHIRKPLLLVKYIGVLLWDILVANMIVARRILSREKNLQPLFMKVPLDVEHQFTITILVSSISLTPGTVAADHNMEERYLLVHSLHETDPDAAIATMKQRYEKPLKEIFEC